jgi:hypothetical protein
LDALKAPFLLHSAVIVSLVSEGLPSRFTDAELHHPNGRPSSLGSEKGRTDFASAMSSTPSHAIKALTEHSHQCLEAVRNGPADVMLEGFLAQGLQGAKAIQISTLLKGASSTGSTAPTGKFLPTQCMSISLR